MENFLPDNTDANWNWSDQRKSNWQECDDGYLNFYMHCRHGGLEFLDAFPYKLSLGEWSDGTGVLPFHGGDTPDGRILVTESYDKMFKRIMAYRASGGHGVVLTGQPGTGKSNFLKFMLAWLLSKQQVVVLCNNALQYLFYRDKVYMRLTALGFVHLPYHPGHPRRSVWGLIDIDFDDRGPPINSDLTIWPIQATSPKSIRWKSWRKQLDGALWGMPLWSLEELIEGLSLSPGYSALRTMLEEYLPQLDGLTAPETGDPKVDAILEVLHLEREREKVVAAAEKEEEEDYPRELRDDIRASTRDQDQMLVDQAEQQVPAYRTKLEQALAILVRTATEEFGFIPRDVYKGIVDLPGTRRQHAEAVDGLDYSNLSNLIRAFTYNKELGMTSRCVFVMFPTENWTTTDDWKIDFKSIRVAELAGEALRRGEDQRIREIYNSIRGLWDGSTLAGRIFEPIAHQVFREGSALQYYPMTSTAAGVEPPTFSTLTTAPALDLPSFPGGRVDTTVDFKSKLSNITLESNRYYVPAGTNHPLFDSFTIDSISRPVVISVFQMTIASKHQGSAQSYFQIRRLKTHVRKLFKDMGVTPPTIEARYFLVCPEDEVERRWEMPAGWGKGERNTHRGKVFYLRVPSPRRTQNLGEFVRTPNRPLASVFGGPLRTLQWFPV